jgi:hypothetical protein
MIQMCSSIYVRQRTESIFDGRKARFAMPCEPPLTIMKMSVDAPFDAIRGDVVRFSRRRRVRSR